MMSICFKEKLKISPDALNELISGCNQVGVKIVIGRLYLKKKYNLNFDVLA
jgi:hypothetical protein